MPDRIERELVLPAPPEEVWEAVTGPGWLADEVNFDLRPDVVLMDGITGLR